MQFCAYTDRGCVYFDHPIVRSDPFRYWLQSGSLWYVLQFILHDDQRRSEMLFAVDYINSYS